MGKVMVFGTFDGLHKGHLNYFKQAREHGDYLIAVVARDNTVKEVKDKFPKYDEKKRLSEVKKYTDKAVLGYAGDKYKVIKEYGPNFVCLGYDQKDFVEGLKKFDIEVKRMKAYKPEKYKSSKLKI
ncbi:adenylyltransferase/cytidyltransferase family protein [Candidatus Woesearchaeota archaeon]|nr:adenylyltransferase/cytidyltransferase family protein [Candidatus Woesearchaeota archaeon]